MADKQHIGWPWTDTGPVVTESQAKGARLAVLLDISTGEHPVRHRMGVGLKDAAFESGTTAARFSISAAVQQQVPTYEPGIAVPPGEQGVELTEDKDGKPIAIVNYFDVDEPNANPDPLEVRLRNG